MDRLLQTQGKDISTSLWHASLAFSPPTPPGLWRASACYFTNTSSLFSAIQIHILHLQSCGHTGPVKATCGQTNDREVRASVCVCEGETVITSGRCRWRSLRRYQLRRRLPVSPVTELDQIQGRTEGQGIWAWLMLASLSFPKYLLGRGRLPEYHVMAILLVYRWYYNHTSV